jgi:hypothetical protein
VLSPTTRATPSETNRKIRSDDQAFRGASHHRFPAFSSVSPSPWLPSKPSEHPHRTLTPAPAAHARVQKKEETLTFRNPRSGQIDVSLCLIQREQKVVVRPRREDGVERSQVVRVLGPERGQLRVLSRHRVGSARERERERERVIEQDLAVLSAERGGEGSWMRGLKRREGWGLLVAEPWECRDRGSSRRDGMGWVRKRLDAESNRKKRWNLFR